MTKGNRRAIAAAAAVAVGLAACAADSADSGGDAAEAEHAAEVVAAPAWRIDPQDDEGRQLPEGRYVVDLAGTDVVFETDRPLRFVKSHRHQDFDQYTQLDLADGHDSVTLHRVTHRFDAENQAHPLEAGESPVGQLVEGYGDHPWAEIDGWDHAPDGAVAAVMSDGGANAPDAEAGARLFGYDHGGDDDVEEFTWRALVRSALNQMWTDADGSAFDRDVVLVDVPGAPVVAYGPDGESLLPAMAATLAPADGDLDVSDEAAPHADPEPVPLSSARWGVPPGPMWLNVPGLGGEHVTFVAPGRLRATPEDVGDADHEPGWVWLTLEDAEEGGAWLARVDHLVRWDVDPWEARTDLGDHLPEELVRAAGTPWLDVDVQPVDRVDDAHLVTINVGDGWRAEDHGWPHQWPELIGYRSDIAADIWWRFEVPGTQRAVVFHAGDRWWTVVGHGEAGGVIVDAFADTLTVG